MAERELRSQIEEECDLPDGWGVNPYQDSGFEVSSSDGKTMAEAVLEVNASEDMVEIAIIHSNMPGRYAAQKMEAGEEVGEYTNIPSVVGYLQFSASQQSAAVEAIDALADPDVLEKMAEECDFVKNEDPMTLREAAVKVAGVDPETIDGTLL